MGHRSTRASKAGVSASLRRAYRRKRARRVRNCLVGLAGRFAVTYKMFRDG